MQDRQRRAAVTGVWSDVVMLRQAGHPAYTDFAGDGYSARSRLRAQQSTIAE
jgi:hypothetical protein